MRIDELFNDPYVWQWKDMRGPVHKMFSAKTAAISLGDVVTAMNPERPSKLSASSGRMAASFDVGKDTIWVTFERGQPGNWFVAFDSQDNKLEKGKDYKLTGAGHPGRILATVIEIVKDFLTHYEPEVLHFTANDPKRASIYRAIVKKIDHYNKYKGHENSHSDEKRGHFNLSR